MRIQEFWDVHPGATIYIVGTGPSMRIFPPEFFRNKITIGLNQAYKYPIAFWYHLTIHPELIPEVTKSGRWFTKRKPPRDDLTLADPNIVVFQNNKDVKDFSYVEKTPDCLYVGRGIHTAAIVLAAQMGAAYAVLVGVDCSQLGPDHHGHAQHVQWHGMEPKAVYDEYRAYGVEVRRRVQERYGMRTLTLNPYMGVDQYEEDYKEQLRWIGLEPLPYPKDVSKYKR